MPSDRTTALPHTDFSRRALLAGGGALIVSFALAPVPAGAQTPPVLAELAKSVLLPGSLNSNPVLESWIKVAADGSVTVFSGKSELGQGIRTALVQD